MSAVDAELQNQSLREPGHMMQDASVIELSAIRRAAKLVERIQCMETPWPAAMHLGTALDALKEVERLIQQQTP